MSVRRAAAEQVRTLSQGGEEFAILDVREEGAFAKGHLLLAASCPLGRLEVLIEAKVPRRSTQLLLVDADGAEGGPAARAAAVLEEWGYTGCSVIDGGMSACEAAGLGSFTGVHVISKAFGELVVEHYGTPMIAPAELQARLSAGDDLVVLDLREEDPIYAGNRFMIYALFPQCRISMHILWGLKRQNTVFAIGKSILDRTSPVNVGELCLAHGGGGHAAAGTCQIANEDAERVEDELIHRLACPDATAHRAPTEPEAARPIH